MSKLTRTQTAKELLERARRGPLFHGRDFGSNTGFQDEAARAYRLWSTTWLLPKLIALVPELKNTPVETVNSEPVSHFGDET